MTNIKEQFKQGRARKINEKNFYLTIKYLYKQTHDNKRLCDDKQKNIIREFYDNNNINALIGFQIQEFTEKLSKLEQNVKNNNLSSFDIESREESDIKHFKNLIAKRTEEYVPFTEKELFDLHSIVTKLDNSIYKSLISWIKQERYRNKTYKYQVSLTLDGKVSLNMLKKFFDAKSYDEALDKVMKLLQNLNEE